MYRANGTGSRFRPFSEGANITSRSYSRPLQRAICDFGADHAFGQVSKKLKEHYGIDIADSAARTVTEYHASMMDGAPEIAEFVCPAADVIIAESDGSMIPIVETSNDPSPDRRKNKQLFWKEARLSLARAKGSSSPYFAGTVGSPEEVGKQLSFCVVRAGANENSFVHCVGDGAPWIANQVEERFGSNGRYLIDFYHLCEYLSAASKVCAPGAEKTWLDAQKEALKVNQHESVLRALQPHLEAEAGDAESMPVKDCHRYIKNRLHQLDYQRALSEDLPIGSGEIESAHRYVIQKRLKLAGAWWTIDNAKHMLTLRVLRANSHWDGYWKKAA